MTSSHWIAALLALTVSLAACIGKDPHEPDAPTTSLSGPVWIHLGASQPVDASRYPGDLPAFELRPVDQRLAYEPTVAITRTGTAFYATFGEPALPYQVPQVNLLRSRDEGRTWTDVTPFGVGALAVGDPLWWYDPIADRVYFAFLYVGCMAVEWTDDEGETWGQNLLACGDVINDHPTLFSGAKPGDPRASILYLCSSPYSGLPPDAYQYCATSTDGGVSWQRATEAPGPQSGCDSTYSGMGHGRASFGPDGTAYLPHKDCGKVLVGISRDGGKTWRTTAIHADEVGPGHDAAVAVDDDGNVYALWVAADGLPRMSTSRDHGKTWTPAIQVAAPGVSATNDAYLGIEAGSPGRVAFHYIGTTATDDFTTAEWYAYVGFTLNALDTHPVFATALAQAPEDPIAFGDCRARPCGHFPSDDYTGMDIDPVTGRVWVALADSCPTTCGEGLAGYRPSSPVVAVQTTGTMLR